jgi:hypothetical protein
MGKRVSRQAIGRNIRAARDLGLLVVGIAPDGTVLTSTESAALALSSPATRGRNSCDDILNQLTGSD